MGSAVLQRNVLQHESQPRGFIQTLGQDITVAQNHQHSWGYADEKKNTKRRTSIGQVMVVEIDPASPPAKKLFSPPLPLRLPFALLSSLPPTLAPFRVDASRPLLATPIPAITTFLSPSAETPPPTEKPPRPLLTRPPSPLNLCPSVGGSETGTGAGLRPGRKRNLWLAVDAAPPPTTEPRATVKAINNLGHVLSPKLVDLRG